MSIGREKIIIDSNHKKIEVSKKRETIKYMKINYDLYLLLIPAILIIFVFRYIPIYGLLIAFKDFNIFDGFVRSPWVGLEQFKKVFSDEYFYRVFFNTLAISALKIGVLFPLPILLSLMLNEVGNVAFKRTVQTFVYLPHFLSWSIVYSIFYAIFSSNGIVNDAIALFGINRIPFFIRTDYFRGILVLSDGWRSVGWGTIIYLAAISSIDPQLYEASIVDGANKFQQIVHITIPGILSTIMVLLILRLGKVLNVGFEQIIIMYNPSVYDVADVIETYVYRIGLGQQRFSYSTAVGFFNSIIGFILVITGNWLGKKFFGRSIW